MPWYGRDPNPAQLEAEAKRKAEAEANEANRRAKEGQASGYRCVTTMPRH